MSEPVDRGRVRREVRPIVRDRTITKGELITTVAATTDAPKAVVREELDNLERDGFVYLVGDGDSAEVRLP